jgi:hypothetical protein
MQTNTIIRDGYDTDTMSAAEIKKAMNELIGGNGLASVLHAFIESANDLCWNFLNDCEYEEWEDVKKVLESCEQEFRTGNW